MTTTKETLLNEFIDVVEAARRLHIHPESVRLLIRKGTLPAMRFSNKWIIDRNAFEVFASCYSSRPGRKMNLFDYAKGGKHAN
jgi:excisionase family DNA binding protein